MNAVCRILVVEDAHVIREPLSRLLKMEGFDVASATDGNEAMTMLEARDSVPVHLVLLDVMMPRMNGVRFLEALRQHHRFARLPVVALTGISDTTQLRRLRELRVSSIVHKIRFHYDELVDEIRRHLSECYPAPAPVRAPSPVPLS